jgi:hypothetical protein
MSTFYLTVFCKDLNITVDGKTVQINPTIIYRITASINVVLQHNWKDVIGYRKKKNVGIFHRLI